MHELGIDRFEQSWLESADVLGLGSFAMLWCYRPDRIGRMVRARHCPAPQRSPSCDEKQAQQAAMSHVGYSVRWIQVCEKWLPAHS